MSLPLFQPEDVYSRAAFNALVTQLNLGLFRSGSNVVDVNGSRVNIPAGQVSGIPTQHVIGAYAGNGTGEPATTQTISLGFTPTAVLICGGDRFDSATDGGFITSGYGMTGASIVSGGFKVTGYYPVGGPNGPGRTYRYIAFR